jgi:predicted alpha/beta-fold hydrolase
MQNADFKPAWWLRSPHLQTLWPVFSKKRYRLDLETERVELDDGDFVDLCWSKKPAADSVLVLHGLEGSLNSHYANSLMYQLECAGFQPVFMYFRGCSGSRNRLPRAYHSGDTGDLHYVVNHIKNKTGRYPKAVAGFSLGANVLLKWLGETGSACPLTKAAAVSVPFTLHHAADRLQQGFSKVYRDYLLRSLRKNYLDKFSGMNSPLNVDVSQLTSFWDYDNEVTAPLHGFTDVQDYYDQSSCRQFLKHIKTPTRIIHALDDPFMYASTPPGENELGEAIDLLLTDRGGHVGFVSGKTPLSAFSWSERKIIEFLQHGD